MATGGTCGRRLDQLAPTGPLALSCTHPPTACPAGIVGGGMPLRVYSPLPEGWRMRIRQPCLCGMPHRLGVWGGGCETGRWQR